MLPQVQQGGASAARATQAQTLAQRRGLWLMLLSSAAFALMAAFAKKLLPQVPQQAVVFSRGVMLSLVFVLLARRQRAPLIGSKPHLLLVRGLLGYGGLSCYFYAVQHLPLGDAVLLQYSNPLFVAALAPLWLGERTTRSQWLLVVMALAGVALIVRPSGAVRPAALVGLGGAVFSALAYMAVRGLSRSEHPLTILVWFPLATIPPSLLATLQAGWAAWPHSATEVAGHLLVAAAALVGQLAMTYGLAQTGAARATAVTLAGPIFGVLFGIAFFATLPTASSLVGTAVVLGALVLLGHARSGGRPDS